MNEWIVLPEELISLLPRWLKFGFLHQIKLFSWKQVSGNFEWVFGKLLSIWLNSLFSLIVIQNYFFTCFSGAIWKKIKQTTICVSQVTFNFAELQTVLVQNILFTITGTQIKKHIYHRNIMIQSTWYDSTTWQMWRFHHCICGCFIEQYTHSEKSSTQNWYLKQLRA